LSAAGAPWLFGPVRSSRFTRPASGYQVVDFTSGARRASAFLPPSVTQSRDARAGFAIAACRAQLLIGSTPCVNSQAAPATPHFRLVVGIDIARCINRRGKLSLRRSADRAGPGDEGRHESGRVRVML
jgi:hypothetical protein